MPLKFHEWKVDILLVRSAPDIQLLTWISFIISRGPWLPIPWSPFHAHLASHLQIIICFLYLLVRWIPYFLVRNSGQCEQNSLFPFCTLTTNPVRWVNFETGPKSSKELLLLQRIWTYVLSYLSIPLPPSELYEASWVRRCLWLWSQNRHKFPGERN